MRAKRGLCLRVLMLRRSPFHHHHHFTHHSPMRLADLREGHTDMCDDLHRLSIRMDSIDEGVAYFWGFVAANRNESSGGFSVRRNGP